MDPSELQGIHLDTDFDAVSGLLDRGSVEPSFALPANRFFTVQGAKADMLAKRRGIKKLIRPENARCVLQHLPEPGDHTHAILRGDFVLCDLITSILEIHGRCPALHLATLGMSAANADTLVSLQSRGLLGELTILCSMYFQQVDKLGTWREVKNKLEGRARFIIARNHCKVICLPTASGCSFVIEGSANLRSSDNTEQIAIFNDAELLLWHCSWMEELAGHA